MRQLVKAADARLAAAVRAAGAVADDYPTDVTPAIVKGFSNGWAGCSEARCGTDWMAADIEAGRHEVPDEDDFGIISLRYVGHSVTANFLD